MSRLAHTTCPPFDVRTGAAGKAQAWKLHLPPPCEASKLALIEAQGLLTAMGLQQLFSSTSLCVRFLRKAGRKTVYLAGIPAT